MTLHECSAAKDYEGSVAAFKQSVEADPAFARGFVDSGSAYSQLEKYSDAEQAFKQAMSIQADSCAACGLGMIYRVQGRRDDAEKYLRQSMELNPKDPCALNQLGRMYYDLEEYPKAIEAFEQELKLERNEVILHFLANSLHHSGKVKESIPHYIEAARLNPSYENIFVDLGKAYHDLGTNDRAVAAFKVAINLEPNDQKAHAFLGVTQFEMGNRNGAMEQYQWMLKKNPEFAAELLKGYEQLSDEVKKVERLKSASKNATKTLQ